MSNNTTEKERASTSEVSSADATPVWVRISDAVRLFGVGRTTLFALIKENRIRSRLLKSRRDALHGIRLISYDSLNEYISGLGEDSPQNDATNNSISGGLAA